MINLKWAIRYRETFEGKPYKDKNNIEYIGYGNINKTHLKCITEHQADSMINVRLFENIIAGYSVYHHTGKKLLKTIYWLYISNPKSIKK